MRVQTGERNPCRAYAASLPVRVNVLLLTIGGFGHFNLGDRDRAGDYMLNLTVELGNGALP